MSRLRLFPLTCAHYIILPFTDSTNKLFFYIYTLGRIPPSIRSLQKSAKLISAKFHSVLQNLTLLFFDFLRIYFFFRSTSSPTR